MDTLHTVLRSIRRETKGGMSSRRDHLDVFREFLDHLDRASKRKAATRAPRVKSRRGRK